MACAETLEQTISSLIFFEKYLTLVFLDVFFFDQLLNLMRGFVRKLRYEFGIEIIFCNQIYGMGNSKNSIFSDAP